jgi:uncharacterized protein (DUF2267 family)
MAKPIKETPTLRGNDAERFLAQIVENERQDHSASFDRAKAVFDRFLAHSDNGRIFSVNIIQTKPR